MIMRHPNYPSTAGRQFRRTAHPWTRLQPNARFELATSSQYTCTSVPQQVSRRDVAQVLGRSGLLLLLVLAIALRSLW